MQGWQVVMVVLTAVLVGALLPVLFQIFATLRAIRANVERLGPKVDKTLDEVQDATRRLNRTGASIEQGVDQVRSVVATAGEAARFFKQIRGSLRTAAAVGGAVGPAIVAAARALGSPGGAAPNGRPPEPRQADETDRLDGDSADTPGSGAEHAAGSSSDETKGDTA